MYNSATEHKPFERPANPTNGHPNKRRTTPHPETGNKGKPRR